MIQANTLLVISKQQHLAPAAAYDLSLI